MQVLKQVLGVDVSRKELVVSLGRLSEDLDAEIYSRRVFANKESGFVAMEKWMDKQSGASPAVQIVMEATGVYHQKLAYYLRDKGHAVSIVLPNKVSNYMRTLEIKTVTDSSCADAIALLGLSRKLGSWQAPKAIYKELQQLTRERNQIVQELSMIKNQLHAEQQEAIPNPRSVARLEERILLLNKQEIEIKDDISRCLQGDPEVAQEVGRLSSIVGIGVLTAVIILAETNGFELIRNRRQLSSYAGFDVREKLSGTSVKGKPRISKRGNRYLRQAMHFPALTAIRYEGRFRDLYMRLVDRHGIKMKALVAVQRVLLEMTYTLFKYKSLYQADYQQKIRSIPLHEQTAP